MRQSASISTIRMTALADKAQTFYMMYIRPWSNPKASYFLRGAFNNYVHKRRGVGSVEIPRGVTLQRVDSMKMSIFVYSRGVGVKIE